MFNCFKSASSKELEFINDSKYYTTLKIYGKNNKLLKTVLQSPNHTEKINTKGMLYYHIYVKGLPIYKNENSKKMILTTNNVSTMIDSYKNLLNSDNKYHIINNSDATINVKVYNKHDTIHSYALKEYKIDKGSFTQVKIDTGDNSLLLWFTFSNNIQEIEKGTILTYDGIHVYEL